MSGSGLRVVHMFEHGIKKELIFYGVQRPRASAFTLWDLQNVRIACFVIHYFTCL